MADAIEESHLTLESRVEQKTANLEQANAALQLLFSSRQLASVLSSAEQLDLLIENFLSLDTRPTPDPVLAWQPAKTRRTTDRSARQ